MSQNVASTESLRCAEWCRIVQSRKSHDKVTGVKETSIKVAEVR